MIVDGDGDVAVNDHAEREQVGGMQAGSVSGHIAVAVVGPSPATSPSPSTTTSTTTSTSTTAG